MNDLEILYEKLIERLNEIEDFINLIEIQKKLLGTKEIEMINNKLLQDYLWHSKKITNSQVQYNAVIISLYSCFENYVDRLSKEFFVQYYQVVHKYDKLPKQIVDNYYKQVGEFLMNPQRYTGIEETQKSIIETLYANINDDSRKSFQLELIANHSANLKMDKVIELFNRVGIRNLKDKIHQNYLFRSYYAKMKERPIAEINKLLQNPKTNTFLELDKLVDARNSVAHDWNESDRISFQSIKDYTIPFIKLLCKVILEIAISELYYIMKVENKLIKYDKAIAVYNKTVLCINNKMSNLRLGNYLFFEDSKNKYGVAKIQSLQIENESKTQIDKQNVDVGIGLDRPIKVKYKFYYCMFD